MPGGAPRIPPQCTEMGNIRLVHASEWPRQVAQMEGRGFIRPGVAAELL